MLGWHLTPVGLAECDLLAKDDAAQVLLLWASKTEGDTFWQEQLLALKEEHGDRFQLKCDNLIAAAARGFTTRTHRCASLSASIRRPLGHG